MQGFRTTEDVNAREEADVGPEKMAEGTVLRAPPSPAASRALAEAAARRAEIDARAEAIAATREKQGRGGLEPVRYTDWEVKGIAVDF